MKTQIYEFSNGLKPVEVASKNNLEVGRILQLNGYNNPRFVITGKRSISEKFPCYGATYETINIDDLVFSQTQASLLRWMAEKTDNRIQTYITDDFMSAEEIEILRQMVKDAESKREIEKKEKAEKRIEYIDGLKKQYTYLEQVGVSKKSTWALGSKNLKTELTREFPGIDFKVKSKSYSGGCSMSVYWTDGPTAEMVEKISNKYEYCTFDGMRDLEEYKDNPFSDIFGGAKYVSTARTISGSRVAEVAAEYGYTVETNEYGNIVSGLEKADNPQEIGMMIYRKSREKNYYQKPVETTKQEPVSNTSPQDIQIRRNKEKNGIEILFPAKPGQKLIDKLKAMGFRWSRHQGLWWRRYDENIYQQITSTL